MHLPTSRGTRGAYEAKRRVLAWAREAFGAPEHAALTLRARRGPGGRSVETVVSWTAAGAPRRAVAIPKPLEAIERDDVRAAVDALQCRELGAAWDEAAAGYEAYFVPRFAPWVDDALEGLGAAELPPGSIVLPCCGTAPELERVVARWPAHPIVGVDLSAGMIERARRRAHEGVQLRVGDAARPDERWGQCVGILSTFGLQQIPDADRALFAWVRALGTGGRLSVVFWPFDAEEEGPFAWLRAALLGRVPTPDFRWEDRLREAVERAGGTIERDETRAHPMAHESARAFFDAVLASGPLRLLARSRGEVFVAGLRRAFLEPAPSGPIRHQPRARWIVAHKADRSKRITLRPPAPR